MTRSEPEPGMLDYDEYVRLIHQVDELVATFEDHPDETTRERVVTLLTAVDLLHRSALNRLVEGLREHGAGGALDSVLKDRVVETLLGLYDLAELDIPEPAEGPPGGDNVVFVPRDELTFGRKAERHA